MSEPREYTIKEIIDLITDCFSGHEDFWSDRENKFSAYWQDKYLPQMREAISGYEAMRIEKERLERRVDECERMLQIYWKEYE